MNEILEYSIDNIFVPTGIYLIRPSDHIYQSCIRSLEDNPRNPFHFFTTHTDIDEDVVRGVIRSKYPTKNIKTQIVADLSDKYRSVLYVQYGSEEEVRSRVFGGERIEEGSYYWTNLIDQRAFTNTDSIELYLEAVNLPPHHLFNESEFNVFKYPVKTSGKAIYLFIEKSVEIPSIEICYLEKAAGSVSRVESVLVQRLLDYETELKTIFKDWVLKSSTDIEALMKIVKRSEYLQSRIGEYKEILELAKKPKLNLYFMEGQEKVT